MLFQWNKLFRSFQKLKTNLSQVGTKSIQLGTLLNCFFGFQLPNFRRFNYVQLKLKTFCSSVSVESVLKSLLMESIFQGCCSVWKCPNRGKNVNKKNYTHPLKNEFYSWKTAKMVLVTSFSGCVKSSTSARIGWIHQNL